MNKTKRTILALILVLGGLGYLITTAVSNTTMYYLTVDEALAKGLTSAGQPMRLSGDVQPGSIDWRPRHLRLAFAVQGADGESVQAVYNGPRPDNFKADVPAILEGRFDSQGVFQADKLMLACPSRFVAEGEETGDVWEKRHEPGH